MRTIHSYFRTLAVFASAAMPLEYSFIARATTVLAECALSNFSSKHKAAAVQCLERCPTDNNKFTFTADNRTYNFLVEGGYTFLVVADAK